MDEEVEEEEQEERDEDEKVVRRKRRRRASLLRVLMTGVAALAAGAQGSLGTSGGAQVELNLSANQTISLSANQPRASPHTSCQHSCAQILDYTGTDINFSDHVANRAPP